MFRQEVIGDSVDFRHREQWQDLNREQANETGAKAFTWIRENNQQVAR